MHSFECLLVFYASANVVARGIMFSECSCMCVWTLSTNISGMDGDIDQR